MYTLDVPVIDEDRERLEQIAADQNVPVEILITALLHDFAGRPDLKSGDLVSALEHVRSELGGADGDLRHKLVRRRSGREAVLRYLGSDLVVRESDETVTPLWKRLASAGA